MKIKKRAISYICNYLSKSLGIFCSRCQHNDGNIADSGNLKAIAIKEKILYLIPQKIDTNSEQPIILL